MKARHKRDIGKRCDDFCGTHEHLARILLALACLFRASGLQRRFPLFQIRHFFLHQIRIAHDFLPPMLLRPRPQNAAQSRRLLHSMRADKKIHTPIDGKVSPRVQITTQQTPPQTEKYGTNRVSQSEGFAPSNRYPGACTSTILSGPRTPRSLIFHSISAKASKSPSS